MRLDPKVVVLHPAGHISQEWQVRLPAGVGLADVFRADTWANIEKLMRQRGPKRPAKDDLIRAIAADGSFDMTCTVIAVSDGYALEYRHGRRPSPVAQVLDDLDALPSTSTSSAMNEQAKILVKRWRSAGVSREDLGTARRLYAKANHPDAGALNGQRLAMANAVLDRALQTAEAA
jgi:hypothetical protein